jgi:hypothetical protein
MKAGRIAGDRKLVAKYTVTEHLGELRQELQMLLGSMFGHEQYEYLSDWLAVGRIEGNRLARSHERPQWVGEPTDSTMRNCYPLPKSRRTEFLPRKQTIEYDRTANLCLVLEQLTDLLEEPLFARRFDVEQDIRFGKQLRDLVQV